MEYTVYGESSSSFDALNSSPKWKYDVFLSFAGKDTRLKFTDHLYDAFNRSGIRAFRDDEGIERGEDLSKQLLQAIEDSLCAVVVLSENYANSKWCLNELQKILECRNKLGQRVFPIFYDVDPSDIRYQRKSFGEALAKHEERFRNNNHNHKGLGWFSAFVNLGLGFKQRFWLPNTHSNMFKLQNWKKALFEIGNLSGWDTRGRRESDLIKNIVGGIWTYLCSKLPTYGDNLVGIESKMVDMMSYLEIGLDDVYFVGLWGMGGIGKTTLARVVYDKISHKFDMCCFLANVRETSQREGLVSLHRKLLSHLKIKNMEIDDVYEGKKILQNLFFNKKVLLVLDDVDHMKQIQILAQSPKWFGRGSRVIITTRDSHLLTTSKVQRIYEVKIMKEEESLQLLSNKAFNQDHPKIDYLELSISVVKYTGGLPLALNVLGSFLCGRSKAEWRDTLDRLKQIPDNDILQILKISYDGLNEEEKTIFLDIACFFKGWRKVEVAQILEDCDLHPTIGMKVLMEKALLIEKKDLLGHCVLEMHDLLEDLGRYIICQESPIAGQRSRLWELEDINEVLKNKKGSKAMQAIVYRYLGDDVVVHPQVFSETSNIRLLILSRDFKPFGGLKCLPSALKVFQWREFPLETLPFEAPLDKLVDIQMHKSKIKKLWNGVQFMKKLKRIDLSYSRYLNETPDFSEVPNLEKLILEGCSSLVKVHPSLGKLHKVVLVNLCNCKNLKSLPRKLEMNSLIELNLFGCSKVELLPEFGEGMKKLSYLEMRDTSVTILPGSLGFLSGLRYLYLESCKILNLHGLLENLKAPQVSGFHLTSLTMLYLRACGLSDESIPDDFGSLSSLILLDLGQNNFVKLPAGCFSSLFRLHYLFLDGCFRLKSLPKLPPRLSRLDAMDCVSMESLSNVQLWEPVSSLKHEHRCQTGYVNPQLKHIESEYLPQRDFLAIIPGSIIPSWFPNKDYPLWNDEDYSLYHDGEDYIIKVRIPQYFRESEWSGIVVCLCLSRENSDEKAWISWSSRAPEDNNFVWKGWEHRFELSRSLDLDDLCIMVFELNEKTCWQHLRGHNNSLHIKLSLRSYRCNAYSRGQILGCGWRVLCEEDMKQWRNNIHCFNRLRAVGISQVCLPDYVLHRSIEINSKPTRCINYKRGKERNR